MGYEAYKERWHMAGMGNRSGRYLDEEHFVFLSAATGSRPCSFSDGLKYRTSDFKGKLK